MKRGSVPFPANSYKTEQNCQQPHFRALEINQSQIRNQEGFLYEKLMELALDTVEV